MNIQTEALVRRIKSKSRNAAISVPVTAKTSNVTNSAQVVKVGNYDPASDKFLGVTSTGEQVLMEPLSNGALPTQALYESGYVHSTPTR